jgi:hypothetical protein
LRDTPTQWFDFDAHEEAIRAAKEQAWSEGYELGMAAWDGLRDNPYRKGGGW